MVIADNNEKDCPTMSHIDIKKESNQELPIPTEWRSTLETIANAIVDGKSPEGSNIRKLDPESIDVSLNNIHDYPDKLGSLTAAAWETSTYLWMGSYWEVLLDLSAHDGSTTDLALHLRVFENKDVFEFEPGLVYVP